MNGWINAACERTETFLQTLLKLPVDYCPQRLVIISLIEVFFPSPECSDPESASLGKDCCRRINCLQFCFSDWIGSVVFPGVSLSASGVIFFLDKCWEWGNSEKQVHTEDLLIVMLQVVILKSNIFQRETLTAYKYPIFLH